MFSSYLFYSINEKYELRNRADVETAKAKVQVKLINELDKINLVMESMEIFMKNSETVPLPTFTELTTPFIDDLNGLILLGWRPAVPFSGTGGTMLNYNENIDSALFSRFARSINSPIGKVPKDGKTEQNGAGSTQMDSTGPLEKTIKSSIEESVGFRKTVFSEPIPQLYDNRTANGLLSMISVYDSTDISVKGVSFGVFDMDMLVKETLRYELPILDLTVRDKLNPEAVLFAASTDRTIENSNTHLLDINAANRVWEVTISPKLAFIGYPHSYESYFMLLLGLFSSALLVIVLKQRDDYLSRLSQEVSIRTRELEESNKLKETLLREIHHRVKNNLQIASSLINLQKRKLTDTAMIDAFTSSQGRISAIALIHEKIYEDQDANAVDLKSYLRDLIKYHRKISPSVSYEIDCPDITIDLDTAVPIALITSELVVNALKHAFTDEGRENSLKILVKEGFDGQIDLAISDNGIGLPHNFNIDTVEGLGFEIVRKLCRQINSKFSFNSTSTGTTFRVLFRQRSST